MDNPAENREVPTIIQEILDKVKYISQI